MSGYRRGLIYASTKEISPKIVLRYNVKEQGLSNDDLSYLKDLSGNGRDMTLSGFSGTESSGVVGSSLIFDGIKDYAIINNLPNLSDFTLLIKRKWLSDKPTSGTLISKNKGKYEYGAFIVESHISPYGDCNTRSYGGSIEYKNQRSEESIFVTPNSYNGIELKRGSGTDTNIMLLGLDFPEGKGYANISFSSLVLYNKTLTPEEIEEAKKLL